ncbi:MAG: class I SAM-dependent methyltransferase [Gammaproteobacteria bacterium]
MLDTKIQTDTVPIGTSAPSMYRIFQEVLQAWRQHEKFLTQRLQLMTTESIVFAEKLSKIILNIYPDRLTELISGYKWMCEAVLEEELYFRRYHRYRLKNFEEALITVYSNTEVMLKYMDGLLLSQLLWSNHTAVLQYYAQNFLQSIPEDFHLLEIGPGHGILLYFATLVEKCESITGWDISQSSLDFTKKTLSSLSETTKLKLEKQDIFKIESKQAFDVIVMSEILEHLEDPHLALSILKSNLAPRGKLFINVPCNSPAPDHIYLFKHPDDVFKLVSHSGYHIEHTEVYPATGISLKRALAQSLTTSVVVVATLK